VKNKRSKNSIFYDSTKNKRRRQEQNHNLQAFNTKNFTSSEKTTIPTEKERDYHYKNNKSMYRNHTAVAPFFTSEDIPSFESNTPSRPDYTYKSEEPKTYLYEFTNSRFLYFLGNLTPKQYLVFITLIALLITEDLNSTEAKIVYAFISNVADTVQTIVEQEVILYNYKHAKANRALGNALHHDLETIYAELAKIKKKLPN